MTASSFNHRIACGTVLLATWLPQLTFAQASAPASGGTLLNQPVQIRTLPLPAKVNVKQTLRPSEELVGQPPSPIAEPATTQPVDVTAIEDPRVLSLRRSDHTVQGSVERWAQNNGWELRWLADIDYHIDTEINYSLDIQNSLETLFDHLSISGPRLHAVMYMQNKVLVVRRLLSN